jgi:hypothetical protein
MIASFELHLRAEKKSPKTIRTYVEAAQWLAAEYLIPAGLTDWADVTARHVQEWTVTLLGRYSDCYANNQFRALQQFFKWHATEDPDEPRPNPMLNLRPPKVGDKLLLRWLLPWDNGYEKFPYSAQVREGQVTRVYGDPTSRASRAAAAGRVSPSSRDPPGTDQEPSARPVSARRTSVGERGSGRCHATALRACRARHHPPRVPRARPAAQPALGRVSRDRLRRGKSGRGS